MGAPARKLPCEKPGRSPRWGCSCARPSKPPQTAPGALHGVSQRAYYEGPRWSKTAERRPKRSPDGRDASETRHESTKRTLKKTPRCNIQTLPTVSDSFRVIALPCFRLPKTAQRPPRSPQDNPRGPKKPHDGPRGPPRAQEAPGGSHDTSRDPKNAAKKPSPRCLPRETKELQMRPLVHDPVWPKATTT